MKSILFLLKINLKKAREFSFFCEFGEKVIQISLWTATLEVISSNEEYFSVY